jgi:FkbM family methyltransferase
LERIGTDYGGWTVPTTLVTSDSVCYAAGVGEDISFDLGMAERFGCTVHAFDPTPRAATYVATKAANTDKFVFHDYGLWSADTTIKFYAPQNPNGVSHSAVNLQGTSSYFEGPVRRLGSIMSELQHDHIDVLKMDIEGAEHEVLNDMLASNIDVRVLAVEFDQPDPLLNTLGMVRRLRAHGYQPVAVDRWNVTFVRS